MNEITAEVDGSCCKSKRWASEVDCGQITCMAECCGGRGSELFDSKTLSTPSTAACSLAIAPSSKPLAYVALQHAFGVTLRNENGEDLGLLTLLHRIKAPSRLELRCAYVMTARATQS